MRGVYVVGQVVTRQSVIGCGGRWDRIAVAIPTPPLYQPTLIAVYIKYMLRRYMYQSMQRQSVVTFCFNTNNNIDEILITDNLAHESSALMMSTLCAAAEAQVERAVVEMQEKVVSKAAPYATLT
jgi:hypothetical protein